MASFSSQQLDAISFEQRSALADLKVAMDSEFSRSLRLARDRLRISRSVALEEQKIATLRHDLKFRTVADELTCLLNAQTKLEENRNQVSAYWWLSTAKAELGLPYFQYSFHVCAVLCVVPIYRALSSFTSA